MPGAKPSILSKSIVGVSLLIFSYSWVDFCLDTKKPASLVAGGLGIFSDLDGRLIQAMAVRRHGGSMMMVVTVMAVALHLLQKLRENPLPCQIGD
jgi:hypothetical protein